MNNSQYTDSQILALLKQNEAGVSIAELCREHGMSDATFYNLSLPQCQDSCRL